MVKLKDTCLEVSTSYRDCSSLPHRISSDSKQMIIHTIVLGLT